MPKDNDVKPDAKVEGIQAGAVPVAIHSKEPPAPADKRDFGRQFMGTLKRIMEDVSTLEVATYVTYGDEKGEITLNVSGSEYSAYLQAYTKISLDADTIALLPVKEQDDDIVVRQELYDIHQEHVEMAKQTRQEMISALLGAIGSVLSVFD